MNYNIAIIKGRGIGPEIIEGAKIVLNRVAEKFNHSFNFNNILPEDIIINSADCISPDNGPMNNSQNNGILLGTLDDNSTENFINPLINSLCLYTEISCIKYYPQLYSDFALKSYFRNNELDILIVNELKDAYKNTTNCTDIMQHTADTAFRAARLRNKKVVGIIPFDSDSGDLFPNVLKKASAGYRDVEYREMTVQDAVYQMIRNPHNFDVIAADRLFGSILTGEAIAIAGSVGMLSHGYLAADNFGLYKTFQDVSLDIADSNKANPIGMIMAAAMMLRYSLGLETEARAIEAAVKKTLDEEYRTPDISYVWFIEGARNCGTIEISRAVAENI